MGMLAVGNVYGSPRHTAQQEADSTIVDVPLFGKGKDIPYYSAERGLPITERNEHEGWQALWLSLIHI